MPASLCHHPCDCIPADLWARQDHTVPSKALSIPKAATGLVPRACALGRLPCREAGGAALEGHQDFSEDESVLKCQTNFPNYLSGHFLPSALEDGGGTFHSLCAGVERGCVSSRELPAAPAAQPRFSPTSSLSHRGCCPGIISSASPSLQPPKPLPAQHRAARCPVKQQTPPLLPLTVGFVVNRQIKGKMWVSLLSQGYLAHSSRGMGTVAVLSLANPLRSQTAGDELSNGPVVPPGPSSNESCLISAASCDRSPWQGLCQHPLPRASSQRA